MSVEQAKIFLETLYQDPQAMAQLQSKQKPDSEEELLRIYAETAKGLGFELSADDIRAAFEEKAGEVAAQTGTTEAHVKELSMEHLDAVAGGLAQRYQCIDTFTDRENCWATDACDKIYRDYKGYYCKRLSRE